MRFILENIDIITVVISILGIIANILIFKCGQK